MIRHVNSLKINVPLWLRQSYLNVAVHDVLDQQGWSKQAVAMIRVLCIHDPVTNPHRTIYPLMEQILK